MSLRDFLPEPLNWGRAPEPRPEPPPVVWPPESYLWCPAPPPCLHGLPPRVQLGRGLCTLDCPLGECGPHCLRGGAYAETWDGALRHWVWLLHHYRDYVPCPGTTHRHPIYWGHRHTCPLCRGDQMIRRPSPVE